MFGSRLTPGNVFRKMSAEYRKKNRLLSHEWKMDVQITPHIFNTVIKKTKNPFYCIGIFKGKSIILTSLVVIIIKICVCVCGSCLCQVLQNILEAESEYSRELQSLLGSYLRSLHPTDR